MHGARARCVRIVFMRGVLHARGMRAHRGTAHAPHAPRAYRELLS